MARIRLRVCAGCSESFLVAHTTLLEISCHGSYIENNTLCLHDMKNQSGSVIVFVFWYALLYVLSSFAIILTRKREQGCVAYNVTRAFCSALWHFAMQRYVTI